MANKAWHLTLVGALLITTVVMVGAMLGLGRKSTGDGTKAAVVATVRPLGPQASAQSRHALLARLLRAQHS